MLLLLDALLGSQLLLHAAVLWRTLAALTPLTAALSPFVFPTLAFAPSSSSRVQFLNLAHLGLERHILLQALTRVLVC
jgi:hypothetical protein